MRSLELCWTPTDEICSCGGGTSATGPTTKAIQQARLKQCNRHHVDPCEDARREEIQRGIHHSQFSTNKLFLRRVAKMSRNCLSMSVSICARRCSYSPRSGPRQKSSACVSSRSTRAFAPANVRSSVAVDKIAAFTRPAMDCRRSVFAADGNHGKLCYNDATHTSEPRPLTNLCTGALTRQYCLNSTATDDHSRTCLNALRSRLPARQT
jgi:hypothetical protein